MGRTADNQSRWSWLCVDAVRNGFPWGWRAWVLHSLALGRQLFLGLVLAVIL